MPKEQERKQAKTTAEKPSLPMVTETTVEKSAERRRLDAVLSLPPHIGDTLYEDDTRGEALLFLLAQTTDRDKVSEYKRTHEEKARIRGRAESVAIVEAAARRTLKRPTGEITADDLASIRSLSLGGTDLTDLTPLAELTALNYLYLNGTQVTDITPLAKLTSLNQLFLNGTQVTDVTPLAELTALNYLYLNGTQVTDVTPLAGLTALIHLYLNGTQVTDVTPLAELTALTQLGLRSTRIGDITPLSKLTALKVLYLESTQVSDVTPLEHINDLTIHGP